MPDIQAEVKRLLEIADPVRREAEARIVIEQARELQAAMARVRGLAVYQAYATHGAAKAARMMGISRAGLYRIITEHAPPEVKEARKDTAMRVAVGLIAALATAQGLPEPSWTTKESGRTEPVAGLGSGLGSQTARNR